MTNKEEWTKDRMKKWVTDAQPKHLALALDRLFERQTTDEQDIEETKHNNGIGFNGCDAPILTSITKWYRKNGFITIKQANLIRKKLVKYSGQLAEIANFKNAQHNPTS